MDFDSRKRTPEEREGAEGECAAPDLESTVARALEAARDRWPNVSFSFEALFDSMGQFGGRGGGLPTRLDEMALVSAVLAGDAQALYTLEREFLAPLMRAISRLVPDASEREDVVQRLRERLLVGEPSRGPRLAAYRGLGSLRAWLEIAAKREALMARRSEKSRREREERQAVALACNVLPDPELAHIREHYTPQFRTALERAMNDLEPSDRMLLRAYFVDGLSIDQLGRVLGVHRVTAWRRVLAAQERCLEAVREELRTTTGSAGAELASLMRLVGAEFHLSVSRVLADP